MYLAFLEPWEGVLDGAPTLHLDAHVVNDSEVWRGVIGSKNLPDLNPRGVLWLDLCASRSLSITKHPVRAQGRPPGPQVYDRLLWCHLTSVHVSRTLK